MIQSVKYFHRQTTILVFTNDRAFDETEISFLKQSGAQIIMTIHDLWETSRVEYLMIEIIRSSFVPIKAEDLIENTEVPFDIYHFMPLNKKWIKIFLKNRTLSADHKNSFVNKSSELYIKRDDVVYYRNYLEKFLGQSLDSKSLPLRIRAEYLAFQSVFNQLMMTFCDHSEANSYEHGQELLKHCESLCENMVHMIGSAPDPWKVLNHNLAGEYGSVERTPARVAMVGIFALHLGIDLFKETLMATLINNTGLIELKYNIARAVKEQNFSKLSDHELELYRSHPILSTNLFLLRKIPLDEKVKKIVIGTHELADGTGFPHQVSRDKLMIESQLIQILEIIDYQVIPKMGQAKKSFNEALKEFCQIELTRGRFSPELIVNLKKLV